jgi:hypothetical protein
MLLGEVLIWLLTPWFRSPAGPRHGEEEPVFARLAD